MNTKYKNIIMESEKINQKTEQFINKADTVILASAPSLIKYINKDYLNEECIRKMIEANHLCIPYLFDEYYDKMPEIFKNKIKNELKSEDLMNWSDELKSEKLLLIVYANLKELDHFFKYIPKKILYEEVLLKFIKVRGFGIISLADVSPSSITYKIALEAIKHDGYNILSVPENLVDENLALAAVEATEDILQDIFEKFRTEEFYAKAIKINPQSIRYLYNDSENITPELVKLAYNHEKANIELKNYLVTEFFDLKVIKEAKDIDVVSVFEKQFNIYDGEFLVEEGVNFNRLKERCAAEMRNCADNQEPDDIVAINEWLRKEKEILNLPVSYTSLLHLKTELNDLGEDFSIIKTDIKDEFEKLKEEIIKSIIDIIKMNVENLYLSPSDKTEIKENINNWFDDISIISELQMDLDGYNTLFEYFEGRGFGSEWLEKLDKVFEEISNTEYDNSADDLMI